MKRLIVTIFLLTSSLIYPQKSKVSKLTFDSYIEGGHKIFREKPKKQIVVEVQRDSIWRSEFQNGKQIGDFIRVEPQNKKLFYHAKIDKKIMYRTFDLALITDEYRIIVDTNAVKEILGFKCHKIDIIVESKDKDNEDIIFTTGYTMYGTSEIKLPLHSLINLNHKIENYFPLEIRIRPFVFCVGTEIIRVAKIE